MYVSIVPAPLLARSNTTSWKLQCVSATETSGWMIHNNFRSQVRVQKFGAVNSGEFLVRMRHIPSNAIAARNIRQRISPTQSGS